MGMAQTKNATQEAVNPVTSVTPKEPQQKVVEHKQIWAIKETPFQKGDDVEGRYVVFNNGEDGSLSAVYHKAIIKNSPYSGIVADGYIWPTKENSEIDSKYYKQIDPNIDKPDEYYHTPVYSTEKNYTLTFKKGDTVYGYKLSFSNDKTYYWAQIKNSPYPGTVDNGAVWPRYTDYNSRSATSVNPDVDQPWLRKYCTVPVSQLPVPKMNFQVGDTVVGDVIFSNGLRPNEMVAVINSPLSGTVSGGESYIWPTIEYINNYSKAVGFDGVYRSFKIYNPY